MFPTPTSPSRQKASLPGLWRALHEMVERSEIVSDEGPYEVMTRIFEESQILSNPKPKTPAGLFFSSLSWGLFFFVFS